MDSSDNLRTGLRERLRIFVACYVLFAFILILRHLLIVLGFSYSIRGSEATFIALALISGSISFFYFFVTYVQKLSPNVLKALSQMWYEWLSASLINKLMILSGFLSLVGSIGNIFDWMKALLIFMYP